MKRIFNIFTILFLICSCVKETDVNINLEKEISDYDNKVMALAKAVNAAVRENSDYRNLIKNEVSKQFDGDYDYLFSMSMDQKVSPSKEFITRSGSSEEITVRELLLHHYESSEVQTKTTSDILDELITEYPELQISVPVHAEEWDPETYIPVIAIIPEDCNYPGVKILPGIDAEGNCIEVDAINEPENPVIVIGQNERLEMEPRIIIDKPLIQEPHIIFNGIYQNGAVRLEFYTVSVLQVNSLTIYRTDANSNSYNSIVSYNGRPNFNTYNDWNVEVGKEYSYYIEAECITGSPDGSSVTTLYSPYVTIIIDPASPNPVLNLTSVNEYSTKNFISWDNPEIEYPTQIFKTTPSMTNMLIATLDPTETYYYDEPVVKGEKWTYLVKKYNPNTGEVSPFAKTYVYNPYRDPSAKSMVIVKRIELDRNQIEGWFEGKPELYITTFGHSKNENGEIKLDTLSSFPYPFERYSNGIADSLSLALADWSFFDDSRYYPVLNIHALEYDRGIGNMDLNVSAKIGVKLTDEIGLETKGNFTYQLSNKGQDCGVAYLRYYQDPNDTLIFPACGLKFMLSE